jgi:hypothetical protein
MRRLLSALLRIGADPSDDEDARLRKLLLLAAALMVAPAAVAWGAVYWIFGQPLAAAVPWTYAVIAAVSIGILAATRDYRWLAIGQFVPFIVLPFALMWVLGGFVSGSAVALWAWIAPLGARIVGHRRAALLLLGAFAVGIVTSAAIRPISQSPGTLPETVVAAFFVLNVVGVAVISFILIDASAGGREGSLASMRGIVRRYFSPDVVNAMLTDPGRQELGGEIADVTVLFADLGGYTTYSGSRPAREVLVLLNALFATAVPPILAEGGTPLQMPGDAVMASSEPRVRSPSTPVLRRGRPWQSRPPGRSWRWSIRTGPDSASASTRAKPWSGISAATSSATSPPSATRPTWLNASRPWPSRIRLSSAPRPRTSWESRLSSY